MTSVAIDATAATRRGRVAMRWSASVSAAFVVTLTRPATWAFGLVGFLAGGGLIVVAWPILVLPTPTGVQNALGGPVSTLAFGNPSAGLAFLIIGAVVALLVAVVTGTLIGAWAEREGIVRALDAAADEGLTPLVADLEGAPGTRRIAALRLMSLAPVLLALALAWRPIYDVAYQELILPSELVTPLPIRVIRAVPELIIAIVAVWLVSDAAAAIAVRRLVLERRGIAAAWLLGWADLVRRPHRVLGTAVVGLGAMVLQLGPVLLAASLGWGRVREILVEGREPALVIVTVMTWVALWLGGLALCGVTAAFRAAAWTFEVPRPA